MITNWQKLKLLIWKNFTIQKRHKIQSLFEILLPLLFASVVVILRSIVPVEYHDEVQHYHLIPTNSVQPIRKTKLIWPKIAWQVPYTPKNQILEKLVRDALTHLKLPDKTPIIPFENATMMEQYLGRNNSFAGIEFDESLANITSLPLNLTFALRFPAELRTREPHIPVELCNWFTHLRFPLFQEYGARNPNDTDGGNPPGYWREGFIPLQASLSYAFVKAWQEVVAPGELLDLPPTVIQRFPNPPYFTDILLKGFEFVLPLLILLSFMVSVINIVKNVAMEKELQLKEAMRIMGLTNWLHWAAWYVKSFVVLLVTVTLLTILLKIPVGDSGTAVLSKTNGFVLWIYLITFSIPTVLFCFLISIFFSKANVAALSSGLVWFCFYAPYATTILNYETMSLLSKLIVCLSSNSALAFGFQIIIRFEGLGIGLQWYNFFAPVNSDDNLSILHTVGMFFFDAMFYLLLLIYFEKVLPNGGNVQEPWYFPLTLLCKKRQEKETYGEMHEVDIQTLPNVEGDLKVNNVGIYIKNLRKEFQNGKMAVNCLNMRLYEDQITVLLGHNGAGKSTTIGMLTGLIKPTSGTAVINNYDILRNMINVRESLGFCPQHNILFDSLTVKEHIYFYATLKGLSTREVDAELKRYIDRLELESKLNSLAGTLSGGQKRKLSVAAALCGNSSIVLLDEPTSGMDPSARRNLWDLLVEEKYGRTILLTTHYMDEADILGDKIAILSNGELECMGSSFYLKKRYGAGYRLICVKRPGCDISRITAILATFIRDIKFESNVGAELTYLLDEEYTSIFKNMFQVLEKHQDELLISSFGVSLTTLEEVFMKVGSDTKNEEEHIIERADQDARMLMVNNQGASYGSLVVLDNQLPIHLLTGFGLIWSQIKAMLLKRWAYTIRNPLWFLVQILVVVLFVILAIFAANSLLNRPDLPPIKLDLEFYKKTVTILEAAEKVRDRQELRPLMDAYTRLIENAKGRHVFIETNNSFSDEILNFSDKNLHEVNTEYLFGATVDIVTYKNLTFPLLICWFNNQGYHTAPISVNLMYNAMLRYVCMDCSINVYNKPLPYKSFSKKNVLYQGNSFGYQLAYNTGIAMSFVGGFLSLFYLKERCSKSKLLQYVSGVKILVYWFVSFFWDVLSLSVIIGIYLLTIYLSDQPDWSSPEILTNLAVILFTSIWGWLPLIYISSLLFSSPTTGFVRITIILIFCGVILFIFDGLLTLPWIDMKDLSQKMAKVLMISPHFAAIDAINRMDWIIVPRSICVGECDLVPNCTMENVCSIFQSCCAPFTQDFYDYEWPGMSRHLLFMFCCGVIGWVVLLFIEFDCWGQLVNCVKGMVERSLQVNNFALDSDVLEEKTRVSRIRKEDLPKYNLVVKNMTKKFGDVLAVKDLSIGVDAAECFGLLGLNGAGKTTTFKMLTGDLQIPIGNAWVQGNSIKQDMSSVYQMIGYCPQFDALLTDLTGYENLKIYTLLRGIPSKHVNFVIRKLSTDLNFQKHINKQVKHYSGGNKRKLSAAVAVVGNPAVIYLDEPTAGMDVATRRLLWNMISRLREEGRSIVLTSHSMEECEALCTRIAIMVNGEFRCLGSSQHLKNKFSKGYTLTVKLQRQWNEDINVDIGCTNIKEFIAKCFIGSILREEHMDLLTYHIPSTDLTWSEMFGLMEKAKASLNIEDYSLGQTTLEQVFLYFTKYQNDPVDEFTESTSLITRL